MLPAVAPASDIDAGAWRSVDLDLTARVGRLARPRPAGRRDRRNEWCQALTPHAQTVEISAHQGTTLPMTDDRLRTFHFEASELGEHAQSTSNLTALRVGRKRARCGLTRPRLSASGHVQHSFCSSSPFLRLLRCATHNSLVHRSRAIQGSERRQDGCWTSTRPKRLLLSTERWGFATAIVIVIVNPSPPCFGITQLAECTDPPESHQRALANE